MRRQIGIAAALTLATAVIGWPVQPRASLIQSASWTAASTPPVEASSDAADPTLSIALTNDGSRRDAVFANTDISGGVMLIPTRMFALSGFVAAERPAAHGAIEDEKDCDSCAAVDPVLFGVGTAAFEFGSFVSAAMTAARFVYDSARRLAISPQPNYRTLGMVGMGNVALVAAGLIGLALTRRRDYTPPG